MLDKDIPRRTLLEGCAATAALIALAGASTALAGEQASLYPPGAQDGGFAERCIHCDLCREACPTHAIGVGSLEDGLADWRMPVMRFHLGPCTTCDGAFRCREACPTGALAGFDPASSKIGIAVVDTSTCQLYAGAGRCTAPCVKACPWDALALHAGNLVVDEGRCNGCGACEFACPAGSYGSYGATGTRGINVRAKGARP